MQHSGVPSSRSGPLAAGTLLDMGDHSVEVLQTPLETGDRYRLRIVAQPGGGPGIDGDDPHVHPMLRETFTCVSGSMRALLGRELIDIRPGRTVEVPAGRVHGFINTGDAPLIVESDVVFLPPGYRPTVDLMSFAAIYDRLRRQANIDSSSGEPPMLQMAVLTDAFRGAVMPAGIAGKLIRPLAFVGRLRGYRPEGPPGGDQGKR